ncbi:MAG: hypothetical protein SchgKO_16750 [Schleiferiaceae bacterium]
MMVLSTLKASKKHSGRLGVLIFIFCISSHFAFGQTKPCKFQRYPADSLINEHLLAECEINTLDEFTFSDGLENFQVEIVERWCPESTVNTPNGHKQIPEETCTQIKWINEKVIRIPLDPPSIDTLVDPDEPEIILLIDSYHFVDTRGFCSLRKIKTIDEFLETMDEIQNQFHESEIAYENKKVLLYKAQSLDWVPSIYDVRERLDRPLEEYRAITVHYDIVVNGYPLKYDVVFQVE